MPRTRSGAAAGHAGYFHEAMYFASDDELVSGVAPFLAGGVAAGEPRGAVLGARHAALLRDALPDADSVVWIEASDRYDRPASAIRSYRQMLTDLGPAAQVRVAGEPPAGAAWLRYEAAINQAYDDFPLWSICLYDRRSLTEDGLAGVNRTHPRLAHPDGRRMANAADPGAFLAGLPKPPADSVQALPAYAQMSDPAPSLARRTVREAAAGVLSEDDLDSLIIAVSEVVTNAMLHGQPPVAVRVWRGTDRIVVTVTDGGCGPADPYAGLVPLSPTATSGRGLWIAFQTVTRVDSWRDANGYTVRLTALQ